MKRAILAAVASVSLLTVSQTGEAQIPARGLSALVCAADVNGNGTYFIGPSGKLVIHVSNDGDGDDTATFFIEHGGDDSTHIVSYSDTDGGDTLNCGDLIESVS